LGIAGLHLVLLLCAPEGARRHGHEHGQVEGSGDGGHGYSPPLPRRPMRTTVTPPRTGCSARAAASAASSAATTSPHAFVATTIPGALIGSPCGCAPRGRCRRRA